MIEQIKEFGKSLVPGYYLDKIVNETAESYMSNYDGMNVRECAKDIVDEFVPKINKTANRRENISGVLTAFLLVAKDVYVAGEPILGDFPFVPFVLSSAYFVGTATVNRLFAMSDYEGSIKNYAQEYILAKREIKTGE
jgi:hypothetical protein